MEGHGFGMGKILVYAWMYFDRYFFLFFFERENGKREKQRLQFGWLFWAAPGLKKGPNIN